MIRSPFDPDPDRPDDPTHLVLANAAGEHSLWPAFAAAPSGWTRLLGPAAYDECVRFVERKEL
ncbi:MbtH family NRPS accessory protein [Streptomyces sp. H27-D2]|uniref:MbtH family NRPS accessory protein n=1 Tax=Streptomyces sp. H27-D2 TaxID=3046304 RepID=UPI002DBB895F|nr:MbtH family NRPS accessory protein [Streptomyces sp. H27-D2]MEC4016951.1 MbtH family NRPS accessory protein [Streptomyces sp. H27-D2]